MSDDDKYWNSKEFLALRDMWYKKLEDSGFNDIETHKEGQPEPVIVEGQYYPALKISTSRISKKLESHPDFQEFYKLAEHFLNDEKLLGKINKCTFEKGKKRRYSKKEIREVWSAYTDGLSVNEVAVKTGKSFYQTKRLINHLVDQMKLHYNVVPSKEKDSDKEE